MRAFSIIREQNENTQKQLLCFWVLKLEASTALTDSPRDQDAAELLLYQKYLA